MIDSRRSPSVRAGQRSVRRPSLSRRTATIGCSRRCTASPRAASAAATESTRKGMSSLTIASRIRRRPPSLPTDSSAKLGLFGARRAAACATKAAAAWRSSSLKPSVSPGSAPVVRTRAISGRTAGSGAASPCLPEDASLATDAVILVRSSRGSRPFGAGFGGRYAPVGGASQALAGKSNAPSTMIGIREALLRMADAVSA